MKPILEIHNISKKFRINHEQQPYLSLRESVFNFLTPKKSTEDFWALKDISFNVEAGETLGIIGKNGAGKSTLLKILSKITPPTSGKIIARGRIASLLEVGTGFHPELSGRENVFMNGSILGMRKKEIEKNFDAIVDFAGVEKFIDTPLKHYSSGMQLRLAFAVAAFLENEILIIDEVLAVGDAEFQKKCLGKMDEISRQDGRTLLFVSHNISAIESLCRTGVVLHKGETSLIGDSKSAISHYLLANSPVAQLNDLALRNDRKGNAAIKFTKIILLDRENRELNDIVSGTDVKFRLFFDTNSVIDKDIALALGINDQYGSRVAFLSNEMLNHKLIIDKERCFFEILIPKIPITVGRYDLTISCSIGGVISDWIQNAFYFDIRTGDFYSTGKQLPEGQGSLLLEYSFK